MTLLVSPDRCARCGLALVFELRVGGGPWRCPTHGPVMPADVILAPAKTSRTCGSEERRCD